jgi:hypothetical protein
MGTARLIALQVGLTLPRYFRAETFPIKARDRPEITRSGLGKQASMGCPEVDLWKVCRSIDGFTLMTGKPG